MVETFSTQVGLDRRGDFYYGARVETSTGRPEIKELVRFDHNEVEGHHLLENAQIILSIDESRAMIKTLNLNEPDQSLLEAKARFELAQTVLDDESGFLFDTVATGFENTYIGTIVRRKSLDLSGRFLIDKQLKFSVRAAALARAFTTFCRRDGSQLVCLADMTDDLISICFVYQDNLIGICHLGLDGLDLNSESDFETISVELKTLINFRLESFFERGITVPLAKLFVSGAVGSKEFLEKLRTHFTVDISTPQINSGFFPDRAGLNSIPLDQYLVALGLAVK